MRSPAAVPPIERRLLPVAPASVHHPGPRRTRERGSPAPLARTTLAGADNSRAAAANARIIDSQSTNPRGGDAIGVQLAHVSRRGPYNPPNRRRGMCARGGGRGTGG